MGVIVGVIGAPISWYPQRYTALKRGGRKYVFLRAAPMDFVDAAQQPLVDATAKLGLGPGDGIVRFDDVVRIRVVILIPKAVFVFRSRVKLL